MTSALKSRGYRLDAAGASKELHGDDFRTVLANGPGKVGDSLGLDKPEYELSKGGQLTIFRDPFELCHRYCDVHFCQSKLAGDPQSNWTGADYQDIKFITQDLVLQLSAIENAVSCCESR